MNTNNPMTVRSKITSKNQVTIPKTVRDFLEVKSSDMIEWKIESNGKVTIIPSKADLWQIVDEQEQKFGNLDTPEIVWGEDAGSEEFDKWS